MSRFMPFRGYRFSSDLRDRLPHILAPPYDKVPSEELCALWHSDPFNAVRLILPPPHIAAGDFATQSATETDTDWYGGPLRLLDDWIRQGVLRQDEPAHYFYRQDFSLDGHPFSRWGVVGALALDDENKPLMHEQTFKAPKEDRLRLLKVTQANLCSIFIVATDPHGTLLSIAETLDTPAIDCSTADGVRHRVYVVTDPEKQEATRAAVGASALMIADGHHRYETAQEYRAWARKNAEPSRRPWADAVMAYVCPIHQEGLATLPTHRVVRDLDEDWLDRLAIQPGVRTQPLAGDVSNLAKDFQTLRDDNATVGATDGDRFVLLSRDQQRDPETYDAVHPALRDVDVIFLHQTVLQHMLKVPEDGGGRISYVRAPQEALALVRETPRAGAFFLRAARPDRVMAAVSQSGQRMPQKSTDFYPKIPTGLVIRLLREPPGS